MHQMAQSSVFLSGMGGFGIEIGTLRVTLLQNKTVRALPLTLIFFSDFAAKNIVLAGVKVCIHYTS